MTMTRAEFEEAMAEARKPLEQALDASLLTGARWRIECEEAQKALTAAVSKHLQAASEAHQRESVLVSSLAAEKAAHEESKQAFRAFSNQTADKLDAALADAKRYREENDHNRDLYHATLKERDEARARLASVCPAIALSTGINGPSPTDELVAERAKLCKAGKHMFLSKRCTWQSYCDWCGKPTGK